MIGAAVERRITGVTTQEGALSRPLLRGSRRGDPRSLEAIALASAVRAVGRGLMGWHELTRSLKTVDRQDFPFPPLPPVQSLLSSEPRVLPASSKVRSRATSNPALANSS